MTTSRPASATQVRARVNPAMHPKVFFAGCATCHNLPISRLGDRLRICWLAYVRLGW